TIQAVVRAAEAEFDRIQVEAGDAPQLRHRRAVAIMALADMHAALGESDVAVRRLDEAIPILAALVEQSPDDAEILGSLHSGYIRMGLIRFDRAQPTDAMRAFQASRAIAERMVARDAGSPVARNNLSISQQRIGDVLRAQNDLDGALREYQASL